MSGEAANSTASAASTAALAASPSASSAAAAATSDSHPLHWLTFECGNPAVECITGRVALPHSPPPVRNPDEEEDETDAGAEAEAETDAAGETVSEEANEAEAKSADADAFSSCLAYLFDIPAHLSLHELHDFLLDCAEFASLLHLQLLRIPSRRAASSDATYAALLHFVDPASASSFVARHDGVRWNSLEPERVVAGLVRRVEFDDERFAFPPQLVTDEVARATPAATSARSPATSPSATPSLSKSASREVAVVSASPLLQHASSSPRAAASAAAAAAAAASSASLLLPPSAASAAAAAPTPSDLAASGAHSCPVCLEPLLPASTAASTFASASASVPASAPAATPAAPSSPLLTLLCHHTFHFSCLSQMCIICGHVGCSRYCQGHAHAHFQSTQHNYAIEVLTQRVWDYAADCYVHRLVRNKTDGKLVELSRVRTLDDDIGGDGNGCATGKILPDLHAPLASSTHAATSAHSSALSGARSSPLLIPPSSSAYASLKLEEFLLEYNFLLSTQLEQQRRCFQQQIDARQAEMKRRKEGLERRLAEAEEQKQQLQAKLDAARLAAQEQSDKLAELQSSLAAAQHQSVQLSSLHSKLLSSASSLRSSQASSESIYASQQESLLGEQDAQIAGLEEQLHDLRFYLDTQRRIDRMDAAAGKVGGVGIKAKLASGMAELQMVEVAPSEEEAKRAARRKKKRG